MMMTLKNNDRYGFFCFVFSFYVVVVVMMMGEGGWKEGKH